MLDQNNKVNHVTMEQVGDRYVVYRTRDNKVMKSINYFAPDLKQFFTQDELDNV